MLKVAKLLTIHSKVKGIKMKITKISLYLITLLISIFLTSCFFGENGAPVVWKLKIGKFGKDIISPNYAIEGDRMYLIVNYLGGQKILFTEVPAVYCIDLKEGEIIWKKDFGEREIEKEGIIKGEVFSSLCKPLIGNKLIYISSWGYIVALDKNTGKVEWKHRWGTGGNTRKIYLYNGTIYWRYYGIDELTGEEKWKGEPKPEYDKYISERIYGKDSFYTVVYDRLTAYDIKTEKVKWKKIIEGSKGALLVSNEYVYLCVYLWEKGKGKKEKVYKLRVDNGEVIWEYDGCIAILEDNIIYGSSGDNTCAIDIENGKEVWFHKGSGISTVYSIIGDVLYAFVKEGGVFAIKKSNGELLWKDFNSLKAKTSYINYCFNGEVVYFVQDVIEKVKGFEVYIPKNLCAYNFVDGKILWKDSKLGAIENILLYKSCLLVISSKKAYTWERERITELDIYAISTK